MNLTEKESILLRRALDKGSSPAEADMAARALINSLRKRGISGYDFFSPQPQNHAPPQPHPRPQPQPQQQERPHYQDSKWDFMREQRQHRPPSQPVSQTSGRMSAHVGGLGNYCPARHLPEADHFPLPDLRVHPCDLGNKFSNQERFPTTLTK
jgi:hypothetical protein